MTARKSGRNGTRGLAGHPVAATIGLLGSILTIAGFFGLRYHTKTSEPPTRALPVIIEKSEPKESKIPEVRFSPVSFQELMNYVYREVHTDIQRDDFLGQHLGRRVTWDGWVGVVSDDREKGISVLIAAEEDGSNHVAFLSFPQDDRAQLASLSFGQKIKVTCTFVEFDSRAHLKDCELVKVWPEEKN